MSDMKYYIPTSSHGGMIQVSKFDDAYVKVSDHEAEIARLRAELDNAAAAAVRNMSLSCEKEREADALRAEAEGLRKTLGEVTQCLADTVNEVGGWAVEEVIEAGMEAAMGASA